MTKQEFESLAGYEVTFEDYNKIIEPMYMVTDLSKQDFVKVIDKKRFALPTIAEMKKEMKKIAQHLYDICGRDYDSESLDRLEKTAKEYAKRVYGIDWVHDSATFVYFVHGYEFEELQRGCSYPKELHIGKGHTEFEKIQLIK